MRLMCSRGRRASRQTKIRMLKEPRRRVRFLRREEADRLIDALPRAHEADREVRTRDRLPCGRDPGARMEPRGSRPQGRMARSWHDEIGRGPRHSAQRGRHGALESTLGQHPRWCFTFAGQRIRKSTTAWDKAKQRAGIEDFRFHDLRHTWPRGVCRAAFRCWRRLNWEVGSRTRWCCAMRTWRRRN